MGFTKTNAVEKIEVLTPQEHQAAEDALRRMGKASASDLSPEQRAALRDSVQNS